VNPPLQTLPKFAHESYWWLRTSIFLFWAVFGIVPAAHFFYLHGGFYATGILVPAFMQRIVVMYAFSAAAFVVYFFKIPGTAFTKLLTTF
jgi:hypothetical protein